MIFSIIVRKKYLYGAFKIIFSPETFSTSLGHTGDNLERRFRRHLGGRGLTLSAPSRFLAENKSFLGNFIATLVFMLERKNLSIFFFF